MSTTKKQRRKAAAGGSERQRGGRPRRAKAAARPCMAVRYQDWPTRLFEFVEGRRHMPFAWGVHDCCLFACDGIRAITGLDPAAGMFRGRYHGAPGAARLVRKHGGVEAIAEKVCAKCGFIELAGPAFAQRGDVVLVHTGDDKVPTTAATARAAVGICLGAAAAFPGPEGLSFVPMSQCRRAWGMGRTVLPAHIACVAAAGRAG